MKNKEEKINKFDRPPYIPKPTYSRPGSMTILQAPTRIANTLYYPNGEVKYVKSAI